MRNPLEVEIMRWRCFCCFHQNEPISRISVANPSASDWKYIEILLESAELFEKSLELGSNAEEEYNNDLKMREETVGRIVDISMPVRYSSGIANISILIDSAKETLPHHLEKMEKIAKEAKFDSVSRYEEITKSTLNICRDLVDTVQLHLHTHLWAIWINESLDQAAQVYEQLKDEEGFNLKFPYVAHPPLIVATIGCTAMIEEVGGHFIRNFTEKKIDLDNTSCEEVLNDLTETYAGIDDYDINAIKETVVDARDDFSHYLIQREDAIISSNILQYIKHCQMCIRLSATLIREMFRVFVSDYQNNIIKPTLEDI